MRSLRATRESKPRSYSPFGSVEAFAVSRTSDGALHPLTAVLKSDHALSRVVCQLRLLVRVEVLNASHDERTAVRIALVVEAAYAFPSADARVEYAVETASPCALIPVASADSRAATAAATQVMSGVLYVRSFAGGRFCNLCCTRCSMPGVEEPTINEVPTAAASHSPNIYIFQNKVIKYSVQYIAFVAQSADCCA